MSWVTIAARSHELENELSTLADDEIVSQGKELLRDAAAAGAAVSAPEDRRVLSGVLLSWSVRLRIITGKLLLPPRLESYKGEPPGELDPIEPDVFMAKLHRGRRIANFHVEGADFTREQITKFNVRNGRFERCTFKRIGLVGGSLSRSAFVECDFAGAELTDVDLEHSRFVGCAIDRAHFKRCRLMVSVFEAADEDAELRLSQTMFEECEMREVDLRGLHGESVAFKDCSMRGAGLSGATGIVAFEQGDISGAALQGADLSQMRFVGVTARSLQLESARGIDEAFLDGTSLDRAEEVPARADVVDMRERRAVADGRASGA